MFITPWASFNIITRGGFRGGTLAELWGPPQSGKSTFAYQTAAMNALHDEDVLVVIIDAESSADDERLKYVFGLEKASYARLNGEKVLLDGGDIVIDQLINKNVKDYKPKYNSKDGHYVVVPSPYLEFGFIKMINIIKLVDKPIIFIYDTISAQPTKSSITNLDGESMYSGGQMETPRILKFYLSLLMSESYGKNTLVLLPNQVYSGKTKFGSTTQSGGGFGLKHNLHYSIKFWTTKDSLDITNKFVNFSLKNLTVTKNKFGPKIGPSDQVLSLKAGGIYLLDESFCSECLLYGVITNSKGWHSIEGIPQSFRWGDLFTKLTQYRPMLEERLLKIFEDQFPLLKILKDAGGDSGNEQSVENIEK